MRHLVTALAIGSALLLNAIGINPVLSHAQDTTLPGAKQLTNPLILTNRITHARVQMMPTTAWLAKHEPPYHATAGSTGGSTASSSAPCTLGTDSSAGDAQVLVKNSNTQFDSLDLTGFGLASDASKITGQISVQNLGNGNPAGSPAIPAVAGGGDIWYASWTYGTNPAIKGYFLEAEFPGAPGDTGYKKDASTGNLPVDFQWGTITTTAAGTSQSNPGGAADGAFDITNNRITISAPLSTVGGPKLGDTLSSAYAQGDAFLGASSAGGLLETADKLASSSTDYHVGQAGTNCPTAKGATTSAGTFPTAGVPANLAYYGGPVVHTIQNHIIWWLPQAGTTTYSDGKTSCVEPGTISYSYEQPASGTAPVGALPGGPDGDTDYQNIIKQYFRDLSGSSFYNLLTQYADEENTSAPAVINNETLAGEWTDNCGYTSTPTNANGGSVTVPGGVEASPVYQTDIQAEVERAIQINHWPTGLGNQYYVYTGYGTTDCFAPPGQASATPTCSVAGPNPGYCAYHGDFQDATGNYVLYADMDSGGFAANPSGVNLCYTSPVGVTDPTHTVNGKAITDPIADAEVSITSHEQFETVSDAQVGTAQQLAPPLAWYDATNGEIGDKCAYNYGNYSKTDGSNINLHGDHYIVQQEWSNWDNGCALTSYQGNGGYGGASDAVSIQKGVTLIGVPVAGIANTQQLVANMERAGQLPAGAITQIQILRNGALQTYTPPRATSAADKTRKPPKPPKPPKPLTLNRTDGILVTSTVAGTWTPSGTPYTTAPTIQLHPGLNLVAATYPNPGLMTDAIFNQIEAETGACTAAILTNAGCSSTVTEIKAIGADGKVIDWQPSANLDGNATWPQTHGNQIPFTSGMEIYVTKAITWKVQGGQCQTIDAAGVCH